MTAQNKIAQHGLKAALAAAALIVIQPAFALSPSTIELNSFWAGAGSVTINYSGHVWYDAKNPSVNDYSVSGGSGGFKSYNLSTDSNKQLPFQSFCVDIFHDFNFSVDSIDSSPTGTPSGLSQAAINNLDRLYTRYGSNIASTSSSNINESAFQLAIWAIVNDGAAINLSGVFDLTGGPIQFSNSSIDGAISLSQKWLNDLGTKSSYNAEFLMVQDQGPVGSSGAQDVVYFSPVSSVSEPQTYAMLLAGLGLLGFIARCHRNQNGTMNLF